MFWWGLAATLGSGWCAGCGGLYLATAFSLVRMTQAPAALALLLASSSLNSAMDAAKAALSVAAAGAAESTFAFFGAPP